MEEKLFILIEKIKSDLREGKYKDALMTISSNNYELFKLNPQATLDLHIKTMMELKLFVEALEQIKDYQSLPYVSQEIEEHMRSLIIKIKKEIRMQTSDTTKTIQLIENKIVSDKLNDVLLAFNFLRKHPELIKQFLGEIRKVFKKDFGQNILYLLITGIEQHFSGVYEINYFGDIIPFDFSSYYTIESSSAYNNLVNELNKYNKNTTIHSFAQQLTIRKLIDLFPFTIDKDDIYAVSLYFVYLANMYMQNDIDGVSFFAKHGISIETIKKIDKKYHLGMYQG